MRISDWSSDVCSSDLPDREYYLSPQFQKQRDAYRAYIVRTLTLIGNANPETAADTIMGFETDIAQASWPIADRRDLGKINNPMSSAELAAYAPGLDWDAWFAGADLGPQQRIIVKARKTCVSGKSVAGRVGLGGGLIN